MFSILIDGTTLLLFPIFLLFGPLSWLNFKNTGAQAKNPSDQGLPRAPAKIVSQQLRAAEQRDPRLLRAFVRAGGAASRRPGCGEVNSDDSFEKARRGQRSNASSSSSLVVTEWLRQQQESHQWPLSRRRKTRSIYSWETAQKQAR